MTVYAGIEGLALRLTFVDQDGAAIDIAPANGELTAKLERPKGGATITYAAIDIDIIDGPGGIAEIVTAPDELDAAGTYRLQGYFDTPVGLYPSSIYEFEVSASLA